MAGAEVNIWPSKDVEGLAQLVESQGLDGLLSMVVLACEIMAREAEKAGKDRQLWKQRAYNAKAYKRMAMRTEGRES